MLAHQVQYFADQRVTAEIAKLAQSGSGKMGFAIGVTSGATQGAFPRDFNRHQGNPAAQDMPPGSEHVPHGKAGTWRLTLHKIWLGAARSRMVSFKKGCRDARAQFHIMESDTGARSSIG